MNKEHFVYSGFEADLEKAHRLDEQMKQQPQMATLLIQHCNRMLVRIQQHVFPEIYAFVKIQLGTAFMFLPEGEPSTNIKQAIVSYEEALRFLSPTAEPFLYAGVQSYLGNAYSSLLTENREANLKRAIACYEEALRFWTPTTDPDGYAMMQHHLGQVYLDMPTKDREANLKRAIAYFNEALRFLSPEAQREYILLRTHLGIAYTHLQVNPLENLQRAIDYFNEALRLLPPETMPLDYANAQLNLGVAYLQLFLRNHINAHLQRTFACFQEGAHFWTPERGPNEYVKLQTNLGIVYNFLSGDRTMNLKQAIACFEEVLRYWTPKTAPIDYAIAQMNLGTTYGNLPTKKPADNLKQAIACYEKALPFLSPQEMPREYARAQMNLGNACTRLARNASLSTEDRVVNLKRAIACYKEALRFWSPQTSPLEYADGQSDLGVAYTTYSQLIAEDRVANVERAIACYREALRFRTPEIAPADYAEAQNNLAVAYTAYSNFSTGEAYAANLKQAIACYWEALRFRTPETAPLYCRTTSLNLAALYFREANWQAALDASLLAIRAGERCYQASFSSEGKAVELRDNASLYQRAAFSAIQCGNIMEGVLLLEQGKTRLLMETLRLRIERPSEVPDGIWQAFENAGTAFRTAQNEEEILAENNRSPIQGYQRHESLLQAYQAYEQKMHLLNADLDKAISQVRSYAPNFLKGLDAQGLQSLLSESQEALITFCITERGSLGIVMSSQSQHIEVVEIKGFVQADLDRIFDDWFKAYQGRNVNQRARNDWEETMMRTLAALGKQLLAPILSRLPAGITQLTFLPSGQLFLFPLHAAPLSDDAQERVCDRYEVSYAPSVDVLTMTKARARRAVSPSLYAIVNPQADPKLIFTQFEGQAIARLFDDCRKEEGRKATKERVMADIRGRSYIHFSCHGNYNWDEPTASGVRLADGQLTLGELQKGIVDLSSARLVTLSACETGMSDVIQGSPQEYVGVPAGFLLAGVPCVISSLWSVPDFSTMLLMERFYRNHRQKHDSFAVALSEAQIWMRRLTIGRVIEFIEQWDQQAPPRVKNVLSELLLFYRHRNSQDPTWCPFAHPYYWAAFTVNGA